MRDFFLECSLDVESILQDSCGTFNARAGRYREGYEDYGELFRKVGETPHRSCLVLTSREKLEEIAVLEGETLHGHGNAVRTVSFSPDGRTLASGCTNHWVKLWDIQTGQCLATFSGHSHWIHSVAFSQDGQILASGSADQSIHLWDIKTGECLRVLTGHQGRVWSVTFSPDRKITVEHPDRGVPENPKNCKTL